MIQDIIAYTIVFAAFGFLIFRILQFFNLTRKKQEKCGDCTSGCSIKELHVVDKIKFNNNDRYKFYL